MKKRFLALAFLMLLTLLTPLTAAAAALPEDVQYFGGSAYKIYLMSIDWEGAKKYCEDLGGHLATITSAGEQTFIEGLNSGSKKLWIGGYRDDNHNWFWVTGESWGYTHWASGEPNNSHNVVSNENRVAVWPKEWNDLNEKNKSEQNGFICEWDLPNRTSFDSTVSPWAKGEMEEAYSTGLVPDFLIGQDLTRPITRAEFTAVAVKLCEALTGEKATGVNTPFTDIAGNACQADIEKAYGLDLINGTSPTTFTPDAILNREQMATLLCRTIKKYAFDGWTLETDGNYYLDTAGVPLFADDGNISGFAKPSVYYMVKMKIIGGVDATHFAPKNMTTEQEAMNYATATRDQAVALALRIYKNADLWK